MQQRADGLCPAAFSAKRRTQSRAEAKLPVLVDNAAVAAGWAGPPGGVGAAGHCSLQLVDVADEIALTPLEGLLELFELRAPALDAILAEHHVGLELGLALTQLRLALLQLERPLVDCCV